MSMDERDSWQAAQWADECARMKRVVEALEAAEKAGTPREEIIVLASECGVASIYTGDK
jgi:hypothetical protein